VKWCNKDIKWGEKIDFRLKNPFSIPFGYHHRLCSRVSLTALSARVQGGGIPCCASFLPGEDEGEYRVLMTKM